MEKGRLLRILAYVSILLLVIWYIAFTIILIEIPSYADKYLIYIMFSLIVLLIFTVIVSMLTNSLRKETIGKVFKIQKSRGNIAQIEYKGLKFWIRSSDELKEGDVVKIVGNSNQPTGRFSATILLAKKLSPDDPEYPTF